MRLRSFSFQRLPTFDGAGDGGAAAAAAAPAPGGGGGGGGADPWWEPHRATLDKDTLSYLDNKKFPNSVDQLKSAALTDKKLGDRNVIAKPNLEKLGEWEGLPALGYDADVAKYGAKIKPPKQPNNGQHDPALFDALVKSAHKRFIPPAMAEGLMQDLSDTVNARLSEAAAKGLKDRETLDADLREEWGQDYDVNVEAAKRVAKTLKVGADDASELEKVIGSPRLLKLFAGLGSLVKEGNLVTADGLGGTAGMTPARASAEMRRLMGDKEWFKVFSDRTHAQNADYHDQYMKLAAVAAKDPDWQAKMKPKR